MPGLRLSDRAVSAPAQSAAVLAVPLLPLAEASGGVRFGQGAAGFPYV